MTVARIFKRCGCGDWDGCPHQWVVRYRTTGGRSSQREQSFGNDLREAEDFALKVEHHKRARTFIDPKVPAPPSTPLTTRASAGHLGKPRN